MRWQRSLLNTVNAAERFLAASRAHDLDAATAELAPDVVMINPGTNDPVTGRESVAAAIRSVDTACDEFRHTHLLSNRGSGEQALFGLVFEAKVGDETLHGVDLLEVDAYDRIRRFTVIARPISALMALGARMRDPGQ
jgi:limonene-1,2-epoxide hydrolase